MKPRMDLEGVGLEECPPTPAEAAIERARTRTKPPLGDQLPDARRGGRPSTPAEVECARHGRHAKMGRPSTPAEESRVKLRDTARRHLPLSERLSQAESGAPVPSDANLSPAIVSDAGKVTPW